MKHLRQHVFIEKTFIYLTVWGLKDQTVWNRFPQSLMADSRSVCRRRIAHLHIGNRIQTSCGQAQAFMAILSRELRSHERCHGLFQWHAAIGPRTSYSKGLPPNIAALSTKLPTYEHLGVQIISKPQQTVGWQ